MKTTLSLILLASVLALAYCDTKPLNTQANLDPNLQQEVQGESHNGTNSNYIKGLHSNMAIVI